MATVTPKIDPAQLPVETLPIERLKLDSRNARKHSRRNLDAIKASLKQFGQRKPLVLFPRGNSVVSGNGTLMAMREWNEDESEGAPKFLAVHVTRFPGTQAEARAYAISDNHTAELSEWEEVILGEQLSSLDEALLDATGYVRREVDQILENLKPAPPPVDYDESADDGATGRYAERVKWPRTQTGDVWHLGPHRLICGDSFRSETLTELLHGQRVDCVLTDPPYAIYGSSSGIGADIADDRMVRPFFEHIARAVLAVIKTFGHVYINCDWRSWAALQDGARVAGLTVKNMIVWDKQSQGMGNMYAQTHELIGFFVHEPPPKAMQSGRRSGHRTVLRPNLVRFPRASGAEREHNAAKPVPLLAELLNNSTDEGQTVLDLFGGSGSTLIAAHTTGRIGFVVEQDPRWCDVIAARWQRVTGERPELRRDGAKPRSVDLTELLSAPETES